MVAKHRLVVGGCETEVDGYETQIGTGQDGGGDEDEATTTRTRHKV